MGSGSFDRSMYVAYANTATMRSDGTRKSAQEVFTRRSIDSKLDPKNIVLRESCDSLDNPNSTPVIVALDVTGSMGMIADRMVEVGLGQLMGGILDTKPVSNPHLMFMAVGDVAWDTAPLQVSQFEADIRIAQQLTDIFLEGRGGGNATESYDLPWYFAATRTKCDAFKKRNKKGYLFTIGDELTPNGVTAEQIRKVFGTASQCDYSAKELLDMAKEEWEVFHIIIEEGNYARSNLTKVVDSWRNLMGNRAIRLSDYTKISEVILSVMLVNEGADPEHVINQSQVPDVIRHALFK